MKKKKRPQSYYIKDSFNPKNKNRQIQINCARNASASNNVKNNINKGSYNDNNNNKNYAISPNSYTDKFKSQVKKFNMYNEMWNKSISDEDYHGIRESIKIQPENIKNDSTCVEKYKVNSTNTRISSAATYCDIGYKSKRLIKGINSEYNDINLYSFEQEKLRSKNNNNKIGTNTIYDIKKDTDKKNLISAYSNNITNKYNNNTETINRT